MAKKSKPIIVVVADEKIADIQGVADHLAAKGMKVEQVMPVTGVITGSSVPTKIPALRKIDGVMSVEEEAVAHLPPPDSPTQ